MTLSIGFVALSLLSVAIANVIYYQPEAVHLAYGGKSYFKLIIFLSHCFFNRVLQ